MTQKQAVPYTPYTIEILDFVVSWKFAGLAELADAPDSKSGGRKAV
jgi:hypothetical protein